MSGEERVARMEVVGHPGYACGNLTQMEPAKRESAQERSDALSG